MTQFVFCIHSQFHLSTDFDRFMGNTTGAACVAGYAYPSRAPGITLVFFIVRIVQALVLSVVFLCISLFVVVSSFFLWSCRPFDIVTFDLCLCIVASVSPVFTC